MTAEERAKALKSEADYCEGLNIESALRFIRAAENEALERAAQAVEEANIYVPGRHMTLGEQAELQHAAWRIRSLKSKPPEGK